MTHVILVRHGQTDWNRDRIFRGRADVPLNEAGREEARKLGKALKDVKIVAAYSSPLCRATETARLILSAHPSVQVTGHPDLTDIHYGEWQGLPLSEVKRRYADLYRRWCEEPHRVQLPGGENLDQGRARAVRALEEICAAHPDRTVLIVAHRVVNKVLLCAVLGVDNRHFWAIKQDNCAVNLFDYADKHRPGDGEYAMHLLNDTCHLKSIAQKVEHFDF